MFISNKEGTLLGALGGALLLSDPGRSEFKVVKLLANGGGGKAVLGAGKLGSSNGGGAGNEGFKGGGNPKVATGGGILELNTPGTGGGGKLVLSADDILDLLGKLEL